MSPASITLATRGSALARAQAQLVADALTARRWDVEIMEVETRGDRISDELIHELGKTGAFVRSLDEKVLEEEADAAVHSLKDIPTDMPGDLIVAAVPERASPEDVLVTPSGTTLKELPTEAIVGTASLRRGAQLQAARPDLEIEPIRGNVDTRLRKLLGPALRRREAAIAAGVEDEDETEEAVASWRAERSPIEREALDYEDDEEYDALVLAAAGLERSGFDEQVETVALPPSSFVPAPGQGAIAVTMRDTDLADRVNRYLDHPPTRIAVTVERTILERIGGGCIAPIGVFASLQGGVIATGVRVLASDGTEEVSANRELPVDGYLDAALELADDLAAEGASELIEAASRTEPAPEPMRGEE